MWNAKLCSDCFRDHGLSLAAQRIGHSDNGKCPNCRSRAGAKLNKRLVEKLAFEFFTWGTLHRVEYGAAPLVVFNRDRESEIDCAPSLKDDIKLFEGAIGVGFFYYGPRLWMLGHIEPLEQLQDKRTRDVIIARVIEEYPTFAMTAKTEFYRIRKAPVSPNDPKEFDAPPEKKFGHARFDTSDFPVLYGSRDLEVCVHECRVTAEDDVYVATLEPNSDLRLLDLTTVLQEDCTEYESLDLAIHMLFLAGQHSYEISRDIAKRVQHTGYDGILFPSYFSLLRTGAIPYETVLGLSTRRILSLMEYEKRKIIPNIALFGRPIEAGHVRVKCLNRLMINQVAYNFHFGPVGVEASMEE